MSVSITVADNRFKLNEHSISLLINRILKSESARGKSVDIVYCRDTEIIPLNRQYKGKNRTTDVLAFDLRDTERQSYLGEIYVNLQVAKRQAAENNVPYFEEVKRLTVHGVLHLLGYRDDTKSNRSRMWSRQEGYL